MPPEPPDPPLVLLDAFCVINLLASSVAEEGLATVPARFAAARIVVEDEVLFVSAVDDDEPEGDHAESRARDSAELEPGRVDLAPFSLLRTWARRATVPQERVREVLRRIQRRASFAPPADDPEAKWWRGMVK